jgi:hypothetical protein
MPCCRFRDLAQLRIEDRVLQRRACIVTLVINEDALPIFCAARTGTGATFTLSFRTAAWMSCRLV